MSQILKRSKKNSSASEDARKRFHESLEMYRRLHGLLGTTVSIIQNQAFETGIEKVQRGEEDTLTGAEEKALVPFLV